MPDSTVRVGVVIRTKDRRPPPREGHLHDVAAQSFPSWAAVVVNDGGPRGPVDAVIDALPEGVRRQGRGHPPHRVARTIGSLANVGVRALSCEFVVLHDDDDLWHPEFLAGSVRMARFASIGYQVSFSRTEIVYERVEGGRPSSRRHGHRSGQTWRRITYADMLQGQPLRPDRLRVSACGARRGRALPRRRPRRRGLGVQPPGAALPLHRVHRRRAEGLLDAAPRFDRRAGQQHVRARLGARVLRQAHPRRGSARVRARSTATGSCSTSRATSRTRSRDSWTRGVRSRDGSTPRCARGDAGSPHDDSSRHRRADHGAADRPAACRPRGCDAPLRERCGGA